MANGAVNQKNRTPVVPPARAGAFFWLTAPGAEPNSEGRFNDCRRAARPGRRGWRLEIEAGVGRVGLPCRLESALCL
jgi:hypothetical protein